ncbi:HNH endonuclease (plasmid) [Pontibacillus sp. ALD_SL1]|uniref:HNH endonuclease n=1 Tax=Pontibacillus sp. ALD_SL1 TaxID=2777185 RepID=UPI001A956971|nr:HNH endonuclease [Pontibacillus sp. ALD_SL1]QST02683.1 HNH endonuclease [Pontibacillus sp. ALD_SL1]
MHLIQSIEQLKENMIAFQMSAEDPEQAEEYADYLKRARTILIWKNGEDLLFGPSRIIGYKENTLDRHKNHQHADGRDTNRRISKVLGGYYEENEQGEQWYRDHLKSLGVSPQKHKRHFWILETEAHKEEDKETEKERITASRLGQGLFRKKLIDYWNGCAISAFPKPFLLRASHIKPWKHANNRERLDVYNGLLLLPHYDVLFDQGMISFSDDGTILLSDALTEDEYRMLDVRETDMVPIEEEHMPYLQFHRELHGFQ